MTSIGAIASSEFWVLFFATVGGVILVFGLCMELAADWMDDRFIPGYKAHKRLYSFGELTVIFGVLCEVAVGGWAANDAWQTKQYAIRNDPHNLPVTYLGAYILVVTRSAGFETNNLGNFSQSGNPEQVRITSSARDPSNIAVLFIGPDFTNCPITTEGYMASKSLVDLTNGENLRYDVGFESQDVSSENKGLIAAKDLKVLQFWLPREWQQRQPEVVGGFAALTINNTVSKRFVIFPQTNRYMVFGVATNNDFVWRDPTRLHYSFTGLSN